MFVSIDRYDHARDPQDLRRKPVDPAWEKFTSHGRWHDGMLRLVSGWKPSRKTFGRSPRSWISLDEISIGIAHYWAQTIPDFLVGFVEALPELSAQAWGEKAKGMASKKWLQEQIRAKTGRRPHQAKYNWLCSGWWWVSSTPEAIAFQAQAWLEDYGASGKRVAHYFGWKDDLAGSDGGKILAACIRMANSGGAKRHIRTAKELAGDTSAMKTLEVAYTSKEAYDEAGRWGKITSWREFSGPAPTSFEVPPWQGSK
jgi:hypothetical protein